MSEIVQHSVVILSRESLFAAALSLFLSDDVRVQVQHHLLSDERMLEGASVRADLTSSPSAFLYVASAEQSAAAEVGTLSETGVPVLVVARTSAVDEVAPLLKAGAAGVLGRDAEPAELRRAVEEIANGHPFVCRRILRRLFTHLCVPTVASPAPVSGWEESLAPREREIVGLLTEGMSNSEIAATLHVSEATVKSNLGRVMTKWNVRDRLQVALCALGGRSEVTRS